MGNSASTCYGRATGGVSTCFRGPSDGEKGLVLGVSPHETTNPKDVKGFGNKQDEHCSGPACGVCQKVPVPEAEACDLDANAVTNPATDMILNMLDPENGPASGLPYQVHYLGPPRPPCESQRLATVHALGKIRDDAAPDPEIATILKLVSAVFKAPATLCALFDEKRVFISEQEGNVIPCGEFPWRWTLCGWSMAFKNPQILVIQDTLEDARFRNNQKVTCFPHVRFYCGAPLVASNGQRLGTLCFADVKPRKFDQASCVMMNNMSELVVRQLEKGIALKLKEKDNKELLKVYNHLQRAVDCYEHSVVLLDTHEKGWKIVYANASLSKHTGLANDKIVGSLLTDLLEGTDGTQLPSDGMLTAAKEMKNARIRMARVKDPNVTQTFSLSFKPAGRQALDESTVPIGVPTFLSPTGSGDDDPGSRFYFMTIAPPKTDKGSSRSSSSFAQSAAGWFHSSSLSETSDGSNSVVQGLQLAHLLGKGSFGWVYYGTWFGTPVAIKVIDDDIRPARNGEPPRIPGAPHQEALMAHELRHPNIVATLKYATHMVPCGRALDACDYMNTAELETSSLSDSKNQMNAKGEAALPQTTQDSPATQGAGGKAWAIIEAHPELESDDHHALLDDEVNTSESAVQRLCQVKASGWTMDENGTPTQPQQGTNGTLKGASALHGKLLASVNDFSPSSSAINSGVGNTTGSSMLQQTWMVMEYCDRGCVQDAVDRGWLRDARDCLNSKAYMPSVLATAFEIASAMQYLHAHDVVHGDLTGWNVLLSSSGATCSLGNRGWVAKVADFGLSRSMELQSRITTRNYGTITHMPPELLSQGTMSKAVDVYSFGVLLWQMYTGSRPWSGMTHAQIIMKVAQQHQELQWDDQVPPAFKSLAKACMAFDMDARPSFTTIVETLDAMQEDMA